MINNIKIREFNSLAPTIKEITFGKRNVIIGPKGGGKSTLFDLLANASKGILLSTTVDALKAHNLEFYSINIDGEEIPASTLNLIKIKKGKKGNEEKSKLYDLRNDVIYQDDNIKKNLSDTTEFDKLKHDFAKDVIETSGEINSFINKVKDVYDAVAKVSMADEAVINWSNSFRMKSNVKKSKDTLIFKLNYTNADISYEAKQNILQLNNEQKNFEQQVNFLIRNLNQYLDNDKSYVSEEYKNMITKKYKEIIKGYNEILEANAIEQKRVALYIKITNAFSTAYKKVTSELKKGSEKSESEAKRLSAFVSQSTNHFKEMASKLKKANQTFENFIIKNVSINFQKEQPTENLLKLELKGDVIFEMEEKFNYLKMVLYNAKKTQNHISNWIMSAREKGVKEWNGQKIINGMAKSIKEEIKVTANGQDYETMSLGQKSIYGIKYKFKHSLGKEMFLDQPEDNLDNYTIASDILELIKNKNEQFFVVTHNANIGILSEPDKVIVGSFQKNDEEQQTVEQYLEGTIKEEVKSSDTAHFLEGGVEYIEDRLKIIKGVK